MSEPGASHETPRRWRLCLGRFAHRALGPCAGGTDARMDDALENIYGRAYAQRDISTDLAARLGASRRGGSEASVLSLPAWLGEIRALFPQSVYQTVQGHAVARFNVTEILRDPESLRDLDPDPRLLGALLALKGRADPAIVARIRELAKRVVEDLMKRMRRQLECALSGARRPGSTAARRSSVRDLAWHATIRANLKHYDLERRVLIAERLRFHGRRRSYVPWTIVLCVDQSGSMATSVIHAAVMATIFSSLPSIHVKLVVFDTAVVDLTDLADDPVDILMSVQLGGGTDIGKAVAYCEARHVAVPKRTILVLLSDFCEGAPPAPLLAAIKRLAGAGVTLLGLAALDGDANPAYDHDMAQMLVSAGMPTAALTPDHFARWIAERIQ